jgi:hypothetical protein
MGPRCATLPLLPRVCAAACQKVELWEYAVLVTNSSYPLEAMAKLYRDRADAENGFDELKNQWGCGDFTTQD